MPQDILNALANIVDGLEYPSESDTPFDPFRWPATGSGGDTARAQVVAHAPPGAELQELSVSDFFTPLNDAADSERFQVLRHVLQALLTHLTVFRAGEIEVHIYLIGK